MVQMRMEGFKKISDDLERVIEKDDSNSSVTTDSDEGKAVGRSCRERLTHTLLTNKFQIGVVCLVIFDCLLVIAELLINLRIFEMQSIETHSLVPQVLHYMSIGILSLFIVEILLKLYAFRLDFFRRKLEIFDAVVVIMTFALDIAFANKEGLESGVGLIVVLRLWRITCILNGIIMSVKTQSERRLLRERVSREACEQELAKFREYCAAQEKEIEVLQGLLRKHGIEFEKVERPVMGRTIAVVAEVNTVTEGLHLPDMDLTNPSA